MYARRREAHHLARAEGLYSRHTVDSPTKHGHVVVIVVGGEGGPVIGPQVLYVMGQGGAIVPGPIVLSESNPFLRLSRDLINERPEAVDKPV